MKISRVGGKISRDSLPPGGQAVQGGKINCYTGTKGARFDTGSGHIFSLSKEDRFKKGSCQLLAEVFVLSTD